MTFPSAVACTVDASSAYGWRSDPVTGQRRFHSGVDEYYKKRERAQFNEAKKLAVEYFDRYGKRPGKEVFHEYFMLFETAEEAQKNDVFRNKIALCQNELDTVKYMSAHKAMFSSYDEFIEKCFEKCTNCIKEQIE